MASRLSRAFSGLLVAALAIGSLTASRVQASTTQEIVLVHDTHVHGNFDSGKTNIAQKAYLIDQIRQHNSNVLFVGNGDDLGTSMLSSVFHGRHIVDAFNTMGLAVDTFGNHDFDDGPANTLTQVQASKFPWVTANLRDAATGDVFGAAAGVKSFVIQEIAGVKIGFTGVAPADTASLSSSGPSVKVLDPAAGLKEVVPQMRAAGAQVVVLLSHLAGVDAEAVVRQVPDIDVVVGDHAAQTLAQPLQIGKTYLSRVGDEYHHLGELHLFMVDGKLDHISFVLHDLKPDTPTSPNVAALVKSYSDKLSASLQEVVGYNLTYLNAMKADNRWRETAMGDLAADVMRDVTKSDVAILNGGGVRADVIFAPGPLTKGDLQRTFPFTNYVEKLQVTGDQLRQALENSVSQLEQGAGRFAQVSGMTYRYDGSAPAGSRVSNILVGGKPLDLTATYTLATVDFVAGGGDGYDVLKSAKVLLSAAGGPLLSTALIQGVANAGTIYPHALDRIRLAKVDFTAGKAKATVAGVGHDMTGTPFVQDGKFYLPVRFVGELYGAQVLWSTNGVNLVRGDKNVRVDGMLVDGRFYAPASVLADLLGLQVQGQGNTITLVDAQ